MSTKSTLILTEKEHWYHEMLDDSIHLEIHQDSLLSEAHSEGVVLIKVRTDSELGKKLKKLISLNL